MTNAELQELVHLLMMCGIMDKTATESGNVTNEEWLRMKNLIDKYQAEKEVPEVKGDLISRSALKEAIENITLDKHTMIWIAGLREALNYIDNAPTVPLPDFKEGYKQAILDGKTNYSRPEGEWIPFSERLPQNRDWYLGVFKEPDTGFIGVPYICDYVGHITKGTTKEGWILRGFTDTDYANEYYKSLECVAWQPLPELYKEGGAEE